MTNQEIAHAIAKAKACLEKAEEMSTTAHWASVANHLNESCMWARSAHAEAANRAHRQRNR